MRDYGKVQTTFWTSDDTSSMSDTGRMLSLYLLTGPHTNQIGCFRLPDGYVCDDLKWGCERVSKGFAELFEKGFATRDNGSKWVFIHKYLKWNEIENPNQGKAAARLFEQVPNRSLVKPLLAKALREFAPRFPAEIIDQFETLAEGFGKPFRNQEQEQEQEQEHINTTVEQKPLDLSVPAVVTPSTDDITQIFDCWKKVMMSPGSVLDDKRRRAIRAALKDYSPGDLCRAIRGCSKSPFHMGVNDRKTKYNGITLILRSAEYIDKFIDLDRGDAATANETMEQRNARIAAMFLGEDLTTDENTIEMEA